MWERKAASYESSFLQMVGFMADRVTDDIVLCHTKLQVSTWGVLAIPL
jgi:hypothetical protein